MRSTAVRFICRVLIALVALYAANDGLLQTYLHDGSDGIVRQLPGRAAMPVLAQAGSEDDREFVPSLDGPALLAPSAAGPGLPPGRFVTVTPRPTVALQTARRERPSARGPPILPHATA